MGQQCVYVCLCVCSCVCATFTVVVHIRGTCVHIYPNQTDNLLGVWGQGYLAHYWIYRYMIQVVCVRVRNTHAHHYTHTYPPHAPHHLCIINSVSGPFAFSHLSKAALMVCVCWRSMCATSAYFNPRVSTNWRKYVLAAGGQQGVKAVRWIAPHTIETDQWCFAAGNVSDVGHTNDDAGSVCVCMRWVDAYIYNSIHTF